MSNRTMLEINHDKTPRSDLERQQWLSQMMRYLSSGNPRDLPKGVTWFGMRHHTTECPMGSPPAGWDNEKSKHRC